MTEGRLCLAFYANLVFDSSMKRTLRDFFDRIGQYNQLVNDYKRAVEHSPDHAMAHVNWGIDLAQEGRMEEALAKFEAASAIAPNRWEVFTNWGVALAKLNRLDEAVEKFQHALSLSPDSAGNYVLWGAALMEQGHLNDAAEKYQKAIALAPDNPEPYVNWGIAQARMGDYYGALKNFKTALSIQAYQPQVYFLWGAVLAEVQDYDSAIEKFRMTLRFAPKHVDSFYFWSVALNRMGRYAEALEKSKKALEYQLSQGDEKAEIYLNQGDILANLNRLDVALANYQHATRLSPDMPEAYLSWGITLCRLGNYAEGYEKLAKARELNPGLIGIAQALGQFLLKEGKLTEALPHLAQADAETPGQVDILLNWSMALVKTGQMELALEKLAEVERRDRWNPQMHYLLGTHYMGAGDYPKAASHLEKALTELPDFEDAAINLSLVLCEIDQTEEAVRRMRPVIRKSAHSAKVNFFYGAVLCRAGDYKEAQVKYQKALQLDSHFAEPMIGLGELYLKQNRLGQAEKILKDLMVEHPKSVPGLFLLGLVLFRQKKFQESAYALDTLLALAPDHLEGRCYRARVAGCLESMDVMSHQFETLMITYEQAQDMRAQAIILSAWAVALDEWEEIAESLSLDESARSDLSQAFRDKARHRYPEIDAYLAKYWL